MSNVIGIDPGSRITGYGVVRREGSGIVYVGSGIIRVDAKKPRPERLAQIKRELDKVISRYAPVEAAVEEVFIAKNPRSALVLGEARGVAILAIGEAEIDFFEYSAREVKRSVSGIGSAHKSQVATMVGKLLGMTTTPATEDETDALAVAFCHMLRMSGVGRAK
jgi:crossover junction endodeoxyribonuclease RuvC